MPIASSELAQGQAFSRSADGEGSQSDTFDRVFKVLLSSPNEVYNPQDFCNVYIGSAHPLNNDLTCRSFSAKFDGESRMVNLVTFKYQSYASNEASSGQTDPYQSAPSDRKCQWTTDTSLMEVPADTWLPQGGVWQTPINPLGERYDGVTKQVPVTNIKVSQFEAFDPLACLNYVGAVNEFPLQFGSKLLESRTVLFRGASQRPHVETFRNLTIRGWIVTYDFVYKRNECRYPNANGVPVLEIVGWRRLQPLEGFNVINDGLGNADVDEQGLTLEHEDFKVKYNFPLAQPLDYAANTQGKRMRAMVGFPCPTGGWAQRPSSSPIALNADGTPRKIDTVAGRYPLLQLYDVQPMGNLAQLLGLRLP
jgi:hypothetical protein